MSLPRHLINLHFQNCPFLTSLVSISKGKDLSVSLCDYRIVLKIISVVIFCDQSIILEGFQQRSVRTKLTTEEAMHPLWLLLIIEQHSINLVTKHVYIPATIKVMLIPNHSTQKLLTEYKNILKVLVMSLIYTISHLCT